MSRATTKFKALYGRQPTVFVLMGFKLKMCSNQELTPRTHLELIF